MRRLSRAWPLFLYLLPLGILGRLEQDPAAPLVPCVAAALASVLLGGYLAHRSGALL